MRESFLECKVFWSILANKIFLDNEDFIGNSINFAEDRPHSAN